LAVGNIGGKPVAICVGSDSRCHAWDLRDGTLRLDRELDDGHGMELGAVTIGELQGRHVIVSSGYAGAVTLWNLDGSITQIIETGSPVYGLAIDGPKQIICSGLMGILAVEIT
jgi:WD40 repeat protein